LNTFVPYSGLHVFTVCVCALLIAALVAAGRRLRGHETAMRWTLGIFALLYWLSYNIWWNRNGFDPAIGLPLHICDLSGVIAPLALLTLNRWLRATLYFWAFCARQSGLYPARAGGRPSLAAVLVALGPAHDHSRLRHLRRNGFVFQAGLAGFAACDHRQLNLRLHRRAVRYLFRRGLRLSRQSAGRQNPAVCCRARALAGARFHPCRAGRRGFCDRRAALAVDGSALAPAIRDVGSRLS
jgi:hypothetical protein